MGVGALQAAVNPQVQAAGRSAYVSGSAVDRGGLDDSRTWCFTISPCRWPTCEPTGVATCSLIAAISTLADCVRGRSAAHSNRAEPPEAVRQGFSAVPATSCSGLPRVDAKCLLRGQTEKNSVRANVFRVTP